MRGEGFQSLGTAGLFWRERRMLNAPFIDKDKESLFLVDRKRGFLSSKFTVRKAERRKTCQK